LIIAFAKTVEFICRVCGQAFPLRSLYEAHRGSRACQERSQVNRTVGGLRQKGLKPLGTLILVPEILRRAGVALRRAPVAYDERAGPKYGLWAPDWAVDGATALCQAGYANEEVVRLLALGPGNEELLNALAMAALRQGP